MLHLRRPIIDCSRVSNASLVSHQWEKNAQYLSSANDFKNILKLILSFASVCECVLVCVQRVLHNTGDALRYADGLLKFTDVCMRLVCFGGCGMLSILSCYLRTIHIYLKIQFNKYISLSTNFPFLEDKICLWNEWQVTTHEKSSLLVAWNDIRSITMIGAVAGVHCVMRFIRMKWGRRMLGLRRVALGLSDHFDVTFALQNEFHFIEKFFSERNLWVGWNQNYNFIYSLHGGEAIIICWPKSIQGTLEMQFRCKCFNRPKVPWFVGIACNNKNRIQCHPTHWQPGSRHTKQCTLLSHYPCQGLGHRFRYFFPGELIGLWFPFEWIFMNEWCATCVRDEFCASANVSMLKTCWNQSDEKRKRNLGSGVFMCELYRSLSSAERYLVLSNQGFQKNYNYCERIEAEMWRFKRKVSGNTGGSCTNLADLTTFSRF